MLAAGLGVVVELVLGADSGVDAGVAVVVTVERAGAVEVGGDGAVLTHIESNIVEVSLLVALVGIAQEVDELVGAELDRAVHADLKDDVFLDDGDHDAAAVFHVLVLLGSAVLVERAVSGEGNGDGALGLGDGLEGHLVEIADLVISGDLALAFIKDTFGGCSGQGAELDIVELKGVLSGIVVTGVVSDVLEEGLEMLLSEGNALARDHAVLNVVGLLIDGEHAVVSGLSIIGHDIKLALAALIKVVAGQGVETLAGVGRARAAHLLGVVGRGLIGVLRNDIVALVVIGDGHAVLIVAGGAAGLGILGLVGGLDGSNGDIEGDGVARAVQVIALVGGHGESEHADLAGGSLENVLIVTRILDLAVGALGRVDLDALDADALEGLVSGGEQGVVAVSVALAVFNLVKRHFMHFTVEGDSLFDFAAEIFGSDLNVGLAVTGQLNGSIGASGGFLRYGCNSSILGNLDNGTIVLECS